MSLEALEKIVSTVILPYVLNKYRLNESAYSALIQNKRDKMSYGYE